MSRNDIAAMIPPVYVRVTAQHKQTGYITSTFNYARNVSPLRMRGVLQRFRLVVLFTEALAVMLHALLSQDHGRIAEGR